MANGFQTLGQVLTGGVNREGAFMEGQNAASQIGLRTAQTEQALANAKADQVKALAAQKQQELRDKLAENPAALANANDETLGRIILSELGSQYSAGQEGALRQQERGFRSTAADPAASALERTRALQARAGVPSPDVEKIGERGYVNLTDDTQTIKPLGAEFASPAADNRTPAERNFDREEQLRRSGADPERVQNFREYANPATVAGAKTTATGQAKRQLDLPAAQSRLASSTEKFGSLAKTAKDIQSNEALWSAVGLGKPIASIPGTEGAKLRGLINTLKAKVGFAVLQDMRDNSKTGGALGNVSNTELQFLQNALASLDANLAPEDFREQLQVLIEYADGAQGRVQESFLNTYPELRQAAAPAAAAAGVAPQAGVVEDGYRFKGGNPADPKNWEKVQ